MSFFFMEILEIDGPSIIKGSIECGGAKNLATKLVIASLLTRSIVELTNVPNIYDIRCAITLCKSVGVCVDFSNGKLTIDARNISSGVIHSDKVTSRMPILYMGVLLHFFNEVVVPVPVGCPLNLKTRKVDLHIKILETFGCEVHETLSQIDAIKKPGRLKGALINLPIISVGATETALMLSVLAEGVTIIRGIAIEPEIRSLILFLQLCGAKISYSGERELTVEGVDSLKGISFRIPGDRLEAASWACMACALNGRIVISGIVPDHLSTFLGVYSMIGGGFRVTSENQMEFFQAGELKSIHIETGPYPQLSTDYQPILASILALADGHSVIHETLFDNRLSYLNTFRQFGINYSIHTKCLGKTCQFKNKDSPHSCIITDRPSKIIAPSSIIDVDTIRSGFAYLILAANAHGTTKIRKINIIERGIENLSKKLDSVGVKHRIRFPDIIEDQQKMLAVN